MTVCRLAPEGGSDPDSCYPSIYTGSGRHGRETTFVPEPSETT